MVIGTLSETIGRLLDVSEHYRTYRSTIGNVQIVDEGCAVAPSYRNYRTVTIGLSERPLSDYRCGAIGVLSEFTIGLSEQGSGVKSVEYIRFAIAFDLANAF